MLKNESGFEYRKEMRYLVGGAGEYEVWTGSAGQMRQLQNNVVDETVKEVHRSPWRV